MQSLNAKPTVDWSTSVDVAATPSPPSLRRVADMWSLMLSSVMSPETSLMAVSLCGSPSPFSRGLFPPLPASRSFWRFCLTSSQVLCHTLVNCCVKDWHCPLLRSITTYRLGCLCPPPLPPPPPSSPPPPSHPPRPQCAWQRERSAAAPSLSSSRSCFPCWRSSTSWSPPRPHSRWAHLQVVDQLWENDPKKHLPVSSPPHPGPSSPSPPSGCSAQGSLFFVISI